MDRKTGRDRFSLCPLFIGEGYWAAAVEAAADASAEASALLDEEVESRAFRMASLGLLASLSHGLR